MMVKLLLYDARDPYAETSWLEVAVPCRKGVSVKQYLREQAGWMGKRCSRSLRRFDGRSYIRIRMTYVPEPGDIIALVPKGW